MMRSFRSRKTTANLSETGYYRLQHTCARGGSMRGVSMMAFSIGANQLRTIPDCPHRMRSIKSFGNCETLSIKGAKRRDNKDVSTLCR